MEYPLKSSSLDKKLGKSFLILFILWTILIIVLIGFNCSHSYYTTYDMVKASAEDVYKKEMTYRMEFMSVLFDVMKSADSAYHFVDIHKVKPSQAGMISHFTSLDAKDPENIPDPWELKNLQFFTLGGKEVYSIEKIGDQRFFRYMQPLIVEKGCLGCHGLQGFKPGDQWGGISVEVPWEPVIAEVKTHILFDVLIYSGIWIIGLLFGRFSWYYLQRYLNKQKLTEAELKVANEKKEAGNQLKTAFIYNISHEVRTPLNGILGFSQMIMEPDISQQEKEQCNMFIKASSARLLNTITNYMDISMIVSGTMEVHLKPFYIHPILQKIKEQFQPIASLNQLKLELKTEEKTDDLALNSDAELLQKIITHLVDNAIKFTPRGEITFGYAIKSGLLEFFVQDSGIGITREAQTRIFENFVQEEVSISRGYEGSGLGLSIAQGLAKLLGSEIHVDSTKGSGSLFFFTMPMGEKKIVEPTVKLKEKKLALIPNPVILIAEDDDINYEFLESILKKIPVTILGATNGQEAVDQCRQHPEISLVLMDLKMPVKDGLEATREIKRFRKNLPIVAVTAFAMSGDEKRAREAGCDDYVPKPTQRKTLVNLLNKYGVIA